MSSSDPDLDQRVVAVVLIATIVLAVGLALGVGISRTGDTAPVTAPVVPPVAAVAVTAPVAPAVAAADDASVVVDSGVVKFYFASGKADLPSGALAALDGAIAAAKAGQRLVLSGYHDATGDPARNAGLARQRALAVRDALVGAGVPLARLELKKPEVAVGTGNDAEARRVDVLIGG